MTRITLLFLSLLLLLTACGSDDPEGFQSPTATFEPGASTVDILLPRNSTIIYAEMIRISGRVEGNPQQFILQLLTPAEEILAETTVDAQAGEWQTELVHGYNGDPTEVEVQAVATDGELYDSTSIILSDLTHRPEGMFASIVVPLDGDTVGGDLVPVEGRASGIESDNLTVELVDSTNAVIDSQTIDLDNPYTIDEVPWNTGLQRGEVTGSATIRISTTDPTSNEVIELDKIAVVLTEAAG